MVDIMVKHYNKTFLKYTNCFFEAMIAKLKYGKQIKLIHIPARENEVYCPHWMWHDLVDDNVYDFHVGIEQKNIFHLCFSTGVIRIRPYTVYERWLKTKSWR